MDVFIGTSGFGYDAWKGDFYPATIKAPQRLAYYASQLDAVEINNTFYALPKRDIIDRWAQQVPPTFRFAIKAPRRITHQLRLGEQTQQPLSYLLETTSVLGSQRGPMLFQMPPTWRKDAPRLQAFLSYLAPEIPAAFEFRHPSWFDDEIYAILEAHSAALCIAEMDAPSKNTPFVATASFGYLRLRRNDYTRAELLDWASKIRVQSSWDSAYVFFKHEQQPPAPLLAKTFRTCLRENEP